MLFASRTATAFSIYKALTRITARAFNLIARSGAKVSAVVAGVFFVVCALVAEASAGILVDAGLPNGGGDDTATFQNILNNGDIVSLRPGLTYTISAPLEIKTSGSGLATASGAPATIHMSAAFNNTDGGAQFIRPGQAGQQKSYGIYAGNISNVTLENFKIRKLGPGGVHDDGKWVSAIWFADTSNSKIVKVEAWGFSLGAVIALDNVTDITVRNSIVRDSYSNINTYAGQGRPQLTGLTIDDSTNDFSEDVTIVGNTFRNLRFGPAAFAAYGYETDGITVVANNAAQPGGNPNDRAQRVHIIGNVFDTVGEGVDFFGGNGLIKQNVTRNTYLFGIKLIHGARNTTVKDNIVTAAGMASITVHGSDMPNVITGGNLIWNNQISEVGRLSAFCGPGVLAAYRVHATCPITPAAMAFWVGDGDSTSSELEPKLTMFFGNTVTATIADVRMQYLIRASGNVNNSLFFATTFNNGSGRVIGNNVDGIASDTAIESVVNRFALADIDNAQPADFFVSESSSGENVVYNRQPLSFSATANPMLAHPINGDPDNLLSGNFNGTGGEDLLFHWKGNGTNRMYLATSGTSFTQVLNPITTGSINDNPDRVESGDFNGDGRTDLMFYWVASGGNYFAYGTSAGGFSQYASPIPATAVNGSPNNVLVGDFDGDGKSDLVFNWSADGKNIFFYGGAAGSFTQTVNPILQASINGYPDRVFSDDFNNDGRDDLGFLWVATDQVRLFFGEANRTFTPN